MDFFYPPGSQKTAAQPDAIQPMRKALAFTFTLIPIATSILPTDSAGLLILQKVAM